MSNAKELVTEWTYGVKMQEPTETHPWGKRVADFSGGGIFGVGATEKRRRIGAAAVADNKARDNYLSRQESQRIESEHRAQHGIGTEFANVVNHKAQHGPISKTLEDMLDAVKDSYHPTTGHTEMEMPYSKASEYAWGARGGYNTASQEMDPHEAATALAAQIAVHHGLLPKESANGNFRLAHLDTFNGDKNQPGHFRAYYAEEGGEGIDGGHIFHLDAGGNVSYLGKKKEGWGMAGLGRTRDKTSPFDPFD